MNWVDFFSPPRLAAAVVALAVAASVTWVYRGRTLPPPQEPSPVPLAFAALEKADRLPVLLKTVSVPVAKDEPEHEAKPLTEHQEIVLQARDVCRKYGGSRVEFNRGRSWRCVYPHRHRRR